MLGLVLHGFILSRIERRLFRLKQMTIGPVILLLSCWLLGVVLSGVALSPQTPDRSIDSASVETIQNGSAAGLQPNLTQQVGPTPEAANEAMVAEDSVSVSRETQRNRGLILVFLGFVFQTVFFLPLLFSVPYLQLFLSECVDSSQVARGIIVLSVVSAVVCFLGIHFRPMILAGPIIGVFSSL